MSHLFSEPQEIVELMSSEEQAQVASTESLSYESFLSSVFTSMGIPHTTNSEHGISSHPSTLNTTTTNNNKDKLPTEDSVLSDEQGSSESICFKTITSMNEESPEEEVCVKRQRLFGPKTHYKKVSSNKLIRVSNGKQNTNILKQHNNCRSGTMYFGSSNDPRQLCQNYCQTGRCPRKGHCRYVHDPSKVIVCPNWLRQNCNKKNCTLQHVKRRELMPHCMLFQKGKCHDDNCTLLHAIFDPKLTPCINFQRSYCPIGEKCMRRHVFGANYGISTPC
eukprot:g7293.t1